MIELKTDKKSKTGLDAKSTEKAINIVKSTLPINWNHTIESAVFTETPLVIRVNPTMDSDNGDTLTARLNIKDNRLQSISFTSKSSGTSTWESTPMNEMYVKAALDNLVNPIEQKPSVWKSRANLFNDIFGTNSANQNDDDDDDFFDIIKDSNDSDHIETIPPILAKNMHGGIIEFDGVYDLEPDAAFNSMEDFESTISEFWYQYQQTIIKYLRDNNVTATTIFTIQNIDRIELKNCELYAITTSGEKVLFERLNPVTQIIITNELLARY